MKIKQSMPDIWKHIRLELELKPRRYKSAAEVAENGGGEGLRLISYVGGIAMCSRSAIAAMTPPMLSAALADNVSTTDTYDKQSRKTDIATAYVNECYLQKLDNIL